MSERSSDGEGRGNTALSEAKEAPQPSQRACPSRERKREERDDEPVDLVALVEEELGQVRSVLPRERQEGKASDFGSERIRARSDPLARQRRS